MDQVQLFKRLQIITMDDLDSFIKGDEDIGAALMKLDMAARTRHVLDHVQFEDMWQERVERTERSEIHLQMKLAPDTLASCWQMAEDMNTLTWQLVLPKFEDIEGIAKPGNFLTYKNMAKRVEILDLENIDIEKACEFLDKAYDFSDTQKGCS